METLLRCGLANAVIAAVLVILLAIVTRIWKNPHFAYALWLIVLVRLVSPPLLQFSYQARDWLAPQSPSPSADPARPIAGGENPLPPTHLSNINPTDAVEHPAARSAQASQWRPSPFLGSVPLIAQQDRFTDAVGGLWIMGTVLYLTFAGLRVGRFAHLVRLSQTPAPGWLEDEVLDIVRSHGLRRAPRLTIVESALPPMVWAVGWRPTLLVPQSILTEMKPFQRRLLLLHELLHIRRHDHAVRWFVLAVLALYWWNPFTWWAVRRLHRAQEECCDAGVLRLHPHEFESYAEAILAVSEFVSCGSLPAAALSIGAERKSNLKRRLTMILSGSRWHKLSKVHLSAVIACGVIVVGISLTTSVAGVDPTTSGSGATKAEPGQQDSRIASPAAAPANPASATTKVEPAQQANAAQRAEKARREWVPYVDDAPVKPAAGEDDLQKLLKERYYVALNSVRRSYRRLQAGEETPANVSDAGRRVLDAQLALDPVNDIHPRELYLRFSKIIEARANNLAATGQIRQEYADAARETRLNAEIQLLQAKQRYQAADVRSAQAEVTAAQTTVEHAKNDWARALADLEMRKVNFDRASALVQRGVNERILQGPRHERGEAEAGVKAATAFVIAAEAQLKTKKARLQKALSAKAGP